MKKYTAGDLEQAINSNLSYIKSETLTNELVFEDDFENGIEIEFDEIKTKLLISK